MLKLNPILREGVVRVGGRLSSAPVDFSFRHPVILPKESHFTDLVVRQYHESSGHCGYNGTLSSLREMHWIERGSSAVKKVLDSCVVCKRQKAPPCEQFMSDLPAARTQIHEPPFFHTGVDYFGPILVKQGRSRVKRYGCIFTCMSVRVIHLEIAFSLTTDSFVQALTRFIKRRGLVAHI